MKMNQAFLLASTNLFQYLLWSKALEVSHGAAVDLNT